MSNLIPSQASSDDQLISLWLHGKAQTTQTIYRGEVERFRTWLQKPLAETTLGDLQNYIDQTQAGNAPATRARATNTLKSLYAFAHRIGYVRFNVAIPLKAPAVKDALAERILSEEDVARIISLETQSHHRALLKLLYGGALRINEAAKLRWRDFVPRGNTAQVTIFGKGGKTGVVLLPDWAWRELQAIAPEPPSPDAPVFPGEGGQCPHRSTLWRWVKASAKRAGVEQASCHWLRHAHGSHALERGASVALVQRTLRHSNVATTSRYLHVRPNESSGGFLAL